jgi:hypothetical protein
MTNMFHSADAFSKCSTMALDTSGCSNVAVHDSFEAQNPLKWPYVYSAKTYLQDALTEWISNATTARMKFGPISAWDVGAVTDMSSLVYGKASFDEDINAWDVSKVTSMSQMFGQASAFNHLLGSWQVGQVTSFSHMFWLASAVNQDISQWNVSRANDMTNMFHSADAFSKCSTMALDTSGCSNVAVHDSFEVQAPLKWPYTYNAKTYLQDALTEWISNATTARLRYGSISAWDVGAVTDMSSLVKGKASFDEDINAWDVSKVTSMSEMFKSATTFNHPLGSWQVGQVTTRASATCSTPLPQSTRTSAGGM